jgi:hypothetical protein
LIHFDLTTGSNIEIVESVRPTGLQKCAGRDGDEVGYLVAKVSEAKRQR